MSREECLDWLYRLKSEIFVYMPEKWLVSMGDALEMAIKALYQQPCEDAISRQAVISIIQNWLGSDTGYSWGEKNMMLCTIDELKNLPSVSTEKTGRWIDQGYKEEWWAEYYNCSECGYGMVGVDNYCPNCGAKMEEEE